MRKTLINFLLQNQILTAALVLAVGWLVVIMREVLIALFVSYILMAAIFPYVTFLRRHKIPKPLAVVIPYLATFGILILIIISLLPFFISQISLLFSILPEYLDH